jgi:HK97 family phage major capsid protein
MPKLHELRDERGRIVHEARAILAKAEDEKRALTAEEQGKWDELIGKQDELRSAIDREEKIQEAERDIAVESYRSKGTKRESVASGATESRTATAEYRSAYAKLLAFGKDALNGDEQRALQADSSTIGGYLVMPQQMVDGLIKALDNDVLIRAKATKYQVPAAASLGVPSLDTDPADANWTTELGVGSEDSSMAFGKRELRPHPLAKLIKVSNKLLRQVPSVESLVTSRLAYKFAVTQEAAFMTGSGAGQPLGVFTASSQGISTGRDVSTGNATTAFTVDGLINVKYSVKAQYQRSGEWIFHRDAVKMLAKLKDGEGQYLWQPSKTEADPDMLLGRPVNMSEYAPNTFTTGLYVGIFGDFSYYWIADALDMQIQRLVELYAATNQTGMIGRMETDGMPVLEEAFARVKLA